MNEGKNFIMTLTRAAKVTRKEPKGVVLYGYPGKIGDVKWFERWFPNEEKAMKHAEKKGWTVLSTIKKNQNEQGAE